MLIFHLENVAKFLFGFFFGGGGWFFLSFILFYFKVVCLDSIGMANGKSETRRDAKTGTLKSETEAEFKFSDLIEKHLYDRHTQNLRL